MLEHVLSLLAGLAGLGGFISVLVNLLKLVGVVKDGTSEKWVQGLNFAAFVIVSVIYFANITVNWGEVDSLLVILSTFIGFVLQIFGSKLTYAATKGMPVIGYSFSKE